MENTAHWARHLDTHTHTQVFAKIVGRQRRFITVVVIHTSRRFLTHRYVARLAKRGGGETAAKPHCRPSKERACRFAQKPWTCDGRQNTNAKGTNTHTRTR